MLVYRRDRYALKIVRAATLKQKMQIKLSTSQYTDTGPTSPSADSIASGNWQGNDWSANV